jgi:hypothetical protein
MDAFRSAQIAAEDASASVSNAEQYRDRLVQQLCDAAQNVEVARRERDLRTKVVRELEYAFTSSLIVPDAE